MSVFVTRDISDPVDVQCPVCSDTYGSYWKLADHISEVHSHGGYGSICKCVCGLAGDRIFIAHHLLKLDLQQHLVLALLAGKKIHP